MFVYYVYFKMKLSDHLEKIKKLEDEINHSMNGFGFSDKMEFISENPLVEIKVKRVLTEEEKVIIINSYNNIKDIKMVCTKVEYHGSDL